MKKLIFISILLGAYLACNAQNSVAIEVTGISDTKGKLYVALYDSKVPFLSDKAISGKIVEITDNVMNIEFSDLEDGEYAIAMFNDENENGILDLGEFGIPMEKYGFSNNVDPTKLFRAPKFDECKFMLKGDTNISIKLISAIK